MAVKDRSALVVTAVVGLAACLAGAGGIALAYNAKDAWVTFALLAPITVGALACAHWWAARGRASSLGRQAWLAVALVAISILAAVWIGAWRMFVSEHDAVVVTVMTGAIAVIAMRAGNLLSRGVIADVKEIGRALDAVGGGDRDLRIKVVGRDELAALAASANSMIERLAGEERGRAEAESARRRLIAAVSHDLRTPLSSLRLLVESVEDGVATGQTRDRYLKQIRGHVDVLSGLVDDLFELSRIEAGDIAWTMDQVELDELVGDTIEAMRLEATTRGVRVVAEMPGGAFKATANPEKLQRVLFNLIQNAIRHTPADGSVTVRARQRAGEVEVEVSDDGAGIAECDRPHVFEPFYRGGSDRSRSSDGAGLGLAVSRAIIEAHGGRIWLEPSRSGTQMRFTLRAAG